MVYFTNRRILKKCIQFWIITEVAKKKKKDSITIGSVGSMQNICRKLITELEIVWRKALGP